MKKFITLFSALVLALSLCACDGSPAPEVSDPPAVTPSASAEPTAPESPSYELIGSSKYVRDGKDCIGYRVEIGDGASEEDMRAVFAALAEGDSYYLHTVWYYELASDVETVGAYTVGMLEEESAGADPVFTPPTITGGDLEKLRAAGGAGDSRSIPNPSFKQEALVPDNAFTPAPPEMFSTPASENGLAGGAYYVEGTVEERAEVGGYDSLRVSTDGGEIWVSAVTIPLEEVSAGDEAVVYFVYSGWSDELDAAAGEYVYHE